VGDGLFATGQAVRQEEGKAVPAAIADLLAQFGCDGLDLRGHDRFEGVNVRAAGNEGRRRKTGAAQAAFTTARRADFARSGATDDGPVAKMTVDRDGKLIELETAGAEEQNQCHVWLRNRSMEFLHCLMRVG